jgi:hypothetical protein
MSWQKPKRIETTELLQFLPPLFKSLDVKKLHPQASLWLNRTAKKGQIKRIIKGYYLNSLKCEMAQKWPELEEIACFIRFPSYVSKEWAMNFHGVLGQFPYTCSLITLAASVGQRNEVVIGNYRLEYSKIKKDLFFGFEKRNNYYLATPEKALLDVMYLENRIPFHDELDYDLLDFKRLREMAEKFPPRVREMVEEKMHV